MAFCWKTEQLSVECPMKIYPYGEGMLYVDLEIDDAPDRRERTHAAARALRRLLPMSSIVLGAGNLAVEGVGPWDELDGAIAEAMGAWRHDPDRAVRHELRAIYNGPDLDAVAEMTGLSVRDVVAVHASREYTVELVGFLPGFGYLSPLDPRLVVARRPTPRTHVPRGSLGIAGEYTGIYPIASPGGWQLIGQVTGVDLFDPERRPPGLLQPGDTVRFIPQHAS
jgi:KipI family sensor histidine kinase inhibitor